MSNDFYPRPPRGGRRTCCRCGAASRIYFYPRPPRGGRPAAYGGGNAADGNFYPRPPRGGRQARQSKFSTAELFLSTPSARRATWTYNETGIPGTISIHALREEGDQAFFDNSYLFFAISIHALREEGDTRLTSVSSGSFDFYPRPPRGGRPLALSASEQPQNFYPRPPRGGRRTAQPTTSSSRKNFYPRPPRGGRPAAYGGGNAADGNFYPRPPRGGRQARQSKFSTAELFLSTPSARRATLTSDHARRIQPHYFYPRPPRGGRRHPAQLVWLARSISIHALREEGDLPDIYPAGTHRNFYPRPPRGGRPSTL